MIINLIRTNKHFNTFFEIRKQICNYLCGIKIRTKNDLLREYSKTYAKGNVDQIERSAVASGTMIEVSSHVHELFFTNLKLQN